MYSLLIGNVLLGHELLTGAETTDLKVVEFAIVQACQGHRHGLVGQEAKGMNIGPVQLQSDKVGSRSI